MKFGVDNSQGMQQPQMNGQAPMNNPMQMNGQMSAGNQTQSQMSNQASVGNQAPRGVINLTKGQKIDLTKGNPNLNKVCIGLGWDVNQFAGGADFDLDASVFMLDASGKCSETGFIFYNNLKGPGVQHMGDNRTGAGDGDDEQVVVTFSEVPANIEKIAVTVTIYDYENRRQNFGMISNAYARVVDCDSDRELCRFNLGENFSVETAVVVCELYRHNGEWKFNAVGSGFAGGLRALGLNYGLPV